MKLLVTGASGQLAQSLVEAGPCRAFEIVALGRPALDISDADSIAAAIADHGPDVIINAGAYTAVDKAESEPDEAMRVNGEGAGNVARAANSAGIPVIHISTDYVFDGTKSAPYVESDLTGPVSAYGRSKLAGENAVRAANPSHVILRTAWVLSPFGNNFLKTMLRVAAARPELGVVDDQTGNPTYAPHLAAAILDIAPQIAGKADAPWGTYHAAGTGDVTWCGLAREIFAQSALHGGPVAAVNAIGTADYPTPARRPANSRLDTSKLAAAFGVTLPPWQQGVAECVARLVPGT